MKIRVFIAEDHTIVRDGLRMILESGDDYEVIGQASHGREAVTGILKLRPDVAIMDIAMPELNGIEASSQIRQAWPDARIIMLSMHTTSEYIVRALKVGAMGYLVKDSAGIEMMNAIRTVHAGRRYLSQKISDQVLTDFMHQSESSMADHPLAQLSFREREILQLVAEGKTSAEIGPTLGISPKTVETYRSRLMDKLGLSNLAGLVKFAIQQGLIKLD